MRVWVFGNPDIAIDSLAVKTAEKLQGKLPGVVFNLVKPGEDLPLPGGEQMVIMDVIDGINEVCVLKNPIDILVSPPRNTVHDFDLGFQLKYLQKLGKLDAVTIIGLPMKKSFTTRTVARTLQQLHQSLEM